MYHPRNRITILCGLLALLAFCFANPAVAGGGDPAVAAKAWPLIEKGALLIDVRTPEEFADGHIDGAINIPYEETDALAAAIGADKQRPVVVYCRSGHRAGLAKTELEKEGFGNIFNASGYEALKNSKP